MGEEGREREEGENKGVEGPPYVYLHFLRIAYKRQDHKIIGIVTESVGLRL